MKVTVSPKLDSKQAVLALGMFENEKENYASLSKELSSELAEAVRKKEFSLKFGEVYSTKIGGLPYKRVVVCGLGNKKELTLEKVRKVMGKIVGMTKCVKQTSLVTNIPLVVSPLFNEELLGRATAEGLILADYKFMKYLSKETQDKRRPLTQVCVQWAKSNNGFGSGLKTGRIIAEAANYVRDLVNEPAGVAHSLYLEKAARKVGEHPKVKVRVMNKPEMEKLGMGALLGVNAGSKNPPKLIFLEYNGAKGAPVALVGKGITFDSGGYNLKPTRYIEDMHTDMAGSAAVLGTIKAAAELGVKKNLVVQFIFQ